MNLQRIPDFVMLFIVSFYPVKGIQLEIYNSIFKNAKCNVNVTQHINTTMSLECVAYCSKQSECSGVNFRSPHCEILATDHGTDVELIGDNGWMCIRK